MFCSKLANVVLRIGKCLDTQRKTKKVATQCLRNSNLCHPHPNFLPRPSKMFRLTESKHLVPAAKFGGRDHKFFGSGVIRCRAASCPTVRTNKKVLVPAAKYGHDHKVWCLVTRGVQNFGAFGGWRKILGTGENDRV